MKGFRRFLSAVLILSLLCSCAERYEEPIASEPQPPSVIIETFGADSSETSSPSEETLSTELFLPPVTQPPETTTARIYKTDPPETESDITETASESDDVPSISPASGFMKAKSDVNVRELPDPDSDRVGHLDKGDKIEITGLSANGWVRVIYKGEEAYINGKYLSTVSDTPEPATTEPTKSTEPPATTVTTTESVTTTAEATTVTTTAATTPATTTVTTTEPEETEDFTEPEPMDVLISPNGYTALNYPVQKAVWLAYLDIDEMIKNASESAFRQRIASEYDKIISLGCNTVYVHVRAFGDAYYYSSIFPFAASYADRAGVMPPYDPLKIMIDEAHSRGLSFHAWVNPMRTTSDDRFEEIDSSYILKQWYDSDATNGTFLVYDRSTDYYWLSPAYPAVRALICAGISEIVSNYNVDGIHIDDYFYPTTSSSFDKTAFEASGEKDRASWRRSVVSSLVKEIYSTVKACNGTVLFGVSPQGNLENNRDSLYADVALWCSQPGYLDYVVPQIYYGFSDKLPFDTAVKQWKDTVAYSGIKLICGIAAYKVGVNTEWSSGRILSDETDYSKSSGYDGVAYYRSGSLFGSASSSPKLMEKETAALSDSVKQF